MEIAFSWAKMLALVGRFVLAWVPCALIAAGEANAAPAELDSAFGVGGYAIEQTSPDDLVAAVALQPDGKIVIAGTSRSTGSPPVIRRFLVARYNATGSPDSTFGTGGRVEIGFGDGNNNDNATALAIQPDGNILVAGYTADNLAVARLQANGTLDPTFGTGGLATVNIDVFDYAHAMALQPDGKIVLAGSTTSSTNRDFLVVRLNSNGSRDTSFGAVGTGARILSLGPDADEAFAVAIQADGKIVAAGYTVQPSTFGEDIGVIRLNTDGSADGGFGAGGIAITALTGPTTGNDRGRAVAVQPDGKVVVAGWGRQSTLDDFVLLRYLANGTLDPAFGNQGRVVTTFPCPANPNRNDAATAMALLAGGRIMVAGFTQCDNSVALARYRADGSLDTNFGPGGLRTYLPSGAQAVVASIAIQADQRVIVAGHAVFPTPSTHVDPMLLRILGDSQYRNLSITKAGTATGTVVSSPAGISCGADCAESYPAGTTITLSATPAAGFAFTGWRGGGCSGTGDCVVDLSYSTTITASFGSVTPPRLVNIATRGPVLTGDNVLIGGFVIGGSSPKTVVVRAVGSPLAQQSVSNFLVNPVLSLFSGQTVIASNDDWQTASNAAALQASGFAPADSLEAAILITLNPGAYTAIVTGAGGTTGVSIIEVFEVDAFTVPLINIATRGPVLTGENVMIGGFIIQGSGPQTVVVRARGPSLIAAGVPNVLVNPVLSLFSGQTVIASNDDWQTASNAAALQSSGFAPSNAQESAILITLNPGAYTAIVRGVGGTTGVGIVEVFAVP